MNLWDVVWKLLQLIFAMRAKAMATGGHGSYRVDVVLVDVVSGADLDRETGPSITL